MDGGGRLARSLTPGRPGGAFARFFPGAPGPGAAVPGGSRLLRFLSTAAPLGRSRSSVSVPLGRSLPRLTGTALALGFFGAVALYGSVLNGSYAAFVATHGEIRDILARGLGLGIDKITITGLVRLPESRILSIAGIAPERSLPFVSAAEMRDRLLAEPFIKSAEVRKLYPGEIAITLVEREPYALWQQNGDLYVVAQDGTPIDRWRDAGLVDLPLVVGEGANTRASSYVALLAAAGPLRSEIRAGMLVSGRRWTLKMANGLDVRLPEDGAADAVRRLVRLQRDARILDKDVLAIDLRIPDRVVVRLSEEAAAARSEGKKKLQRGVKGIDT